MTGIDKKATTQKEEMKYKILKKCTNKFRISNKIIENEQQKQSNNSKKLRAKLRLGIKTRLSLDIAISRSNKILKGSPDKNVHFQKCPSQWTISLSSRKPAAKNRRQSIASFFRIKKPPSRVVLLAGSDLLNLNIHTHRLHTNVLQSGTQRTVARSWFIRI